MFVLTSFHSHPNNLSTNMSWRQSLYNIEKAMKTLLILRHAKSSWKEQDLPDHDRPLNKRGKNDVPRMGKSITSLKYHYHELEHSLLGFL
jgi:hypothetical protein